MKRILLNITLSLLLMVNGFFTNLIYPIQVNEIELTTEPELQVYEVTSNIQLGRFSGIETIESGLAKSYIDTVGVSKAFFNVYDDNYQITNQYILNEEDYPKLSAFTSNEIVNFSNTLWIDNYLITYYHTDDTLDSSSRHKLIVVDITDLEEPSFYFVNLVEPLDSSIMLTYTFDQINSDFELEYKNNIIYLTSIEDETFFSISEISFDLNIPLEDDYNVGSIIGLINTDSNINTPTSSSILDYCQTINNSVYCIDNAFPDTYYSLTIADLDIDTFYFANNLYYFGSKTVDDTTIFKIYKYSLEQLDSGYSLSINLENSIETIDSYIDFVHINRNYNDLVLFNSDRKYTIDLTSYELTQVFFPYGETAEVLFNEDGKKLEVEIDEDRMLASSDYYNLTFVISTYGYQILDINYYNNKLLFLANSGLNEYTYYSYDIVQNNYTYDSDFILDFTKSDIVDSINSTNLESSYVIDDISLMDFNFFEDTLFIVESGKISTDGLVNVIELKPNHLIRAYYYLIPTDTVFETFEFSIYQENSENRTLSTPVYIEGLKSILELVVNSAVTNEFSFAAYFVTNQKDLIFFFYEDEVLHQYYININNYYIEYLVGSGLDQIAYNIPLDPKITEILANRLYGLYYTDFEIEFPYRFIQFIPDANNNLMIRTAFGNTFVIYGPKLRETTEVGIVGINDDFDFEVEDTNFELAVSNVVNTLNIIIGTPFKRVLIDNDTPFSLNVGQNLITITLESLNNTIKTITFDVFRLPKIVTLPPIRLESSMQNSVVSSSISSSISSEILSTSSSSSSVSSIITSNSSISSAISSSLNGQIEVKDSINQDDIVLISILMAIPLVLTIVLLIMNFIVKKSKKPRNDKSKR